MCGMDTYSLTVASNKGSLEAGCLARGEPVPGPHGMAKLGCDERIHKGGLSRRGNGRARANAPPQGGHGLGMRTDFGRNGRAHKATCADFGPRCQGAHMNARGARRSRCQGAPAAHGARHKSCCLRSGVRQGTAYVRHGGRFATVQVHNHAPGVSETRMQAAIMYVWRERRRHCCAGRRRSRSRRHIVCKIRVLSRGRGSSLEDHYLLIPLDSEKDVKSRESGHFAGVPWCGCF